MRNKNAIPWLSNSFCKVWAVIIRLLDKVGSEWTLEPCKHCAALCCAVLCSAVHDVEHASCTHACNDSLAIFDIFYDTANIMWPGYSCTKVQGCASLLCRFIIIPRPGYFYRGEISKCSPDTDVYLCDWSVFMVHWSQCSTRYFTTKINREIPALV